MKGPVRILVTGDFCPVNGVNDLIIGRKTEQVFNNFQSIINNADFAITNLECPLTSESTHIVKIGPLMKADIQCAEFLSQSGFKLVTLANNHIMDYGIVGLKSTIESCINNGLHYVGAGEDYSKAREIYLTNVGGRTIAILNYAENEYSTSFGNSPGANPFEPINVYHDMTWVKNRADYVFVIYHGGHEMYPLPSPRIKKTFRYLADLGADVVVSHHSHCFSGYEVYNGTFIFYGLGNFIFHKPSIKHTPWNYGYAVEIVIGDSLTFNLIPFSQCNDDLGLRLSEGRLKEEFFELIGQLNTIISNDDMLADRFEDFCNSKKRLYTSYLEPHSIRLFHFLRSKKLFPTFIGKKKKSLYLNLVRCESHRDVIVNLLKSQ